MNAYMTDYAWIEFKVGLSTIIYRRVRIPGSNQSSCRPLASTIFSTITLRTSALRDNKCI